MFSLREALQFLGENRVEYIASKQGEAIQQAYKQDTGPGKPKNLGNTEDILKWLAKADPSAQHENLQWLANRYIKNDFSLEDILRVKHEIQNFHAVRPYVKDKSLLQYDFNRLDKEIAPLAQKLPAILARYQQEVQGGARMAPSVKGFGSAQEVMKELLRADPTPDKQFIMWMMDQYTSGNISIGNLKKVKDDLTDLMASDALKGTDVAKLTPRQLYDLLTKSGPQKKLGTWTPTSEEKAMMDKGEFRLVYADDQVRIFTPETHKASRYLAGHSPSPHAPAANWCTAWDQAGQFHSYSRAGKLYIVHTPDGKYQFHFEHQQFMNSQDRPAELGALIERYPQIGDVFKDLATKHGVLGLIRNPGEDAMMAAVTKRADRIKELRPGILTPKIVRAAMDNVEKYHLKDVFGYINKFRPDLVTPEIKLLAIKADPASIKSINPKELKQEEVKAAVAGKDPAAVVDAFRWLEEKRADLVTDDVREDVLRKDGSVLTTIGKKATKGMVAAAFEDTNTEKACAAFAYAMENMPDKVTDPQITKMAGRTRFALKSVPEERQSTQAITAALDNDLGAFSHILNPSEDVIVKALAEGPFMLKDRFGRKDAKGRNKVTTALLKRVADIAPKGLLHELGGFDTAKHLPPNIDLEQVIVYALSKDGQGLTYVEKQTPEMIRTAVEQSPDAWRYADKKVLTKDQYETEKGGKKAKKK